MRMEKNSECCDEDDDADGIIKEKTAWTIKVKFTESICYQVESSVQIIKQRIWSSWITAYPSTSWHERDLFHGKFIVSFPLLLGTQKQGQRFLFQFWNEKCYEGFWAN